MGMGGALGVSKFMTAVNKNKSTGAGGGRNKGEAVLMKEDDVYRLRQNLDRLVKEQRHWEESMLQKAK